MISSLSLQIKPVRDSMTEALQLWKKLAGITDGAAESQNASQGVLSCLSRFTSDFVLLEVGGVPYFFLVPSNYCSISM